MSETNSSTPPKTARMDDSDQTMIRTWTPEQLLERIAETWERSIKMRNGHNREIEAADAKAKGLVERYKAIEAQLDTADQEFLAMDLLDPKVSDVLIAVENGVYEKPPSKSVYDFLGSETPFETLMGELMLRRIKAAPAPALRENY